LEGTFELNLKRIKAQKPSSLFDLTKYQDMMDKVVLLIEVTHKMFYLNCHENDQVAFNIRFE